MGISDAKFRNYLATQNGDFVAHFWNAKKLLTIKLSAGERAVCASDHLVGRYEVILSRGDTCPTEPQVIFL